jgi:hypothetical protein
MCIFVPSWVYRRRLPGRLWNTASCLTAAPLTHSRPGEPAAAAAAAEAAAAAVAPGQREGAARSLAYVRDRVGVPRDMSYPAAMYFRAYLNLFHDQLLA